MNKLLKFNEAVSNDNTYIEILEFDENEDNVWIFFLKKKGNEEFIKKLKNTISQYDRYMVASSSSTLEMGDENVPESDVDVLVKRGNHDYVVRRDYIDFKLYNKCNRKLSPDIIDDGHEEDFIESFYHCKFFKKK